MFLLSFILFISSAQLIADTSNMDLESGLMCVFSNDFGYTLIGEKPVSVEQSLTWYLSEDVGKRGMLFSFLKSSFRDSDKFIFKILSKHGYMELINKKALVQQIKRYSRLGAFIKKKYGSCEAFLKALENAELDIFDAVDGDSVLIAIALGYGEENGEFFVRRIDVGEYLQKYPIVSFFPFDQRPGPYWAFSRDTMYFREPTVLNKPVMLPQFESLECEWRWIKSVSRDFGKDPYPPVPEYISLPSFVSRYGRESDAINQKFSTAKDKLARLFCGKKFSKVIVEEVSKK